MPSTRPSHTPAPAPRDEPPQGDPARLPGQIEDLQRRLAEAETFAAIHQAFSQTLELDPLLQLIVDSVPALIPHAARAVFHTYQEDTGLLLPTAVWGADITRRPPIILSRGQGLAGRVVQTRTPINVGNVTSDPRWQPSAGPSPYHSMLIVPVLSGETVLGALNAQSARPQAFDDRDERLLARLAGSAALALRNAYLYDRERTQRLAFQALSPVEGASGLPASGASGFLDIDDAFDRILRYLLWLGLAESANLMLITGGELRVVSYRGYTAYAGVDAHFRELRVPLDAPYYRQMLQTGRPVWVDDVTQDPDWIILPGQEGFRLRSWAAAPLTLSGRIVGFLNLDSLDPAAFDQDIARRLDFIAGFAATLLENTRLHERLLAAVQAEQQARERLETAEKFAAFGRLASTTLHEISNPLQALQNWLYSLGSLDADGGQQGPGELSEPDARVIYGLARSEVERLAGLLIQFRQTQRQPAQPRRVPLDPGPILDRVQALVARQLESAGIGWTAAPAPECQILADPDQMVQVFLNLALNAIDAIAASRQAGGPEAPASAEAGAISITYDTGEPGWLGIRMADSGPGIDPQLAARLFNPFNTTKPGGLGLGLSICSGILRQHGGRLGLDSRPGQGAAFTAWLPCPDESTA